MVAAAKAPATPGPGRGPVGEAIGFASSDAILARNFTAATPTEQVRPSSARIRALICSAISRGVPWSRRAPVTSRNASSSEIPSTSGVTSWKSANTSRETSA